VVQLSRHPQDFVLEQWSLPAGDRARAHWFLRDGAARLVFFLGVAPSSKLRPPALSGVELAFDPRLRCDSDQELEALLFARGFTSSPGALAFDRRVGGLTFWTRAPVTLGIASELRRRPQLVASDVGGGVPIAFGEGRMWRLLPSGVVETVEEDDGSPQLSFPTVDAFVGFLAQRARPWKRFGYKVEV
jgi:hypothetical protein